MNSFSVLFTIAEYLGTVAFAISGASVAVKCRLDIFGVITLGGVTALGGGCIRDLLMGALPPKMFTSFGYLLCAAAASVIVFILAFTMRGRELWKRPAMGRALNFIDALGLGAFAATGTELSVMAGYSGNMFMCVFMGAMTAVGGGALRDIMINGIPAILIKDVYAVAAIFGSIIYYLMYRYIPIAHLPTFGCIVVTVIIRLIVYEKRWNLPRIKYEQHTDK